MKSLRSKHFRRVLAPVIAVSLVSACGKWTVVEMAPRDVIADQEPERVRLTMLDGEEIELYGATVTNGHIVGQTKEGYDRVALRPVMSSNVRIAVDSVTHIEIRETDVFKTVWLVTMVLSAVVAVEIFKSISEWDPPRIGGG